MFRFYSKPSNTQARVAVVGEHSEGVLKIAVARCSVKDHFIKKKGRAIAEGRLHKNKLYDEIKMEKCEIKDFIKVAEETIKKVQKGCDVYNTPPKELKTTTPKEVVNKTITLEQFIDKTTG
jgi:hypothetical protein